MSRHRDIRNRKYSYDDYDYYDDDDDDYYYEEEEDTTISSSSSAYNNTNKPTTNTTTNTTTTKQQNKIITKEATTTAADEGKVLQLVNMGFNIKQCRSALQVNHNNVDAALAVLLETVDTPPTNNNNNKNNNNNNNMSNPVYSASATVHHAPSASSSTTKKKGQRNNSVVDLSSSNNSNDDDINSNKNYNKKPSSVKDVTIPLRPPAPAPAPAPSKQQHTTATATATATTTTTKRLNMIVLGHVDHGKSTLMGQLLLQLGYVDQRTMTKFQKQSAEIGKSSFALAWVMDTDESERERGVTMEVGSVRVVHTRNYELGILDAPGHRDFIPAVIAGAVQADVGLLVISAATGEFEAGLVGQTKEHIVLARGLGVTQLIVAVNKLDTTEPAWDKARYSFIKETITPYILKCGFKHPKIKFIPVSGINGYNLNNRNNPRKILTIFDDCNSSSSTNNNNKEEVAPPHSSWYDGPTLVEAIDSFTPAPRNVDKPLRVIVSDVFAEGKGVTVSGRIVQGSLNENEKVVVLPIGDYATVGRIDHTTNEISSSFAKDNALLDEKRFNSTKSGSSSSFIKADAVAGDSVDILLADIDVARVSSGSVLCHQHSKSTTTVVVKQQRVVVPVKHKFIAKIVVMDDLKVPIINGAQVSIHIHTLDLPACISKLISTPNSKRPTRVLTAGTANASVEITLSENICIEEFSECRALGRFVLRRAGDTIAVGIIEQLIQ